MGDMMLQMTVGEAIEKLSPVIATDPTLDAVIVTSQRRHITGDMFGAGWNPTKGWADVLRRLTNSDDDLVNVGTKVVPFVGNVKFIVCHVDPKFTLT